MLGLLIAALGLRLNDGYTELDVAGELGLEKRGEARLLVGACNSPGLLVVHGRRDATFPRKCCGECVAVAAITPTYAVHRNHMDEKSASRRSGP